MVQTAQKYNLEPGEVNLTTKTREDRGQSRNARSKFNLNEFLKEYSPETIDIIRKSLILPIPPPPKNDAEPADRKELLTKVIQNRAASIHQVRQNLIRNSTAELSRGVDQANLQNSPHGDFLPSAQDKKAIYKPQPRNSFHNERLRDRPGEQTSYLAHSAQALEVLKYHEWYRRGYWTEACQRAGISMPNCKPSNRVSVSDTSSSNPQSAATIQSKPGVKSSLPALKPPTTRDTMMFPSPNSASLEKSPTFPTPRTDSVKPKALPEGQAQQIANRDQNQAHGTLPVRGATLGPKAHQTGSSEPSVPVNAPATKPKIPVGNIIDRSRDPRLRR